MVPADAVFVQAVLCAEVQATSPLARTAHSATMPSIVRQRRRCAGIPKSRRQASAAPPVCHGNLRCVESIARHVPELLAVVETVMVAVCAAVPDKLTGLLVPKLNVGGSTALAGPEVTTAARLMLPLNPATGVTVIVEDVPDAPAVTLTLEAEIVKPGVEEAVMVTDAAPDDVL